MEEPITNIEVRMSIPPQTYLGMAQEIMGQYSNVVKEALEDIKNDLVFNKKFQEEVKSVVRSQMQDAVENAIKSAARRVVWDMYSEKNLDIEKMVTEAIYSTMKTENK